MANLKIELYFIFGQSIKGDSKAFTDEMNKFDDIVIGDFIDSYNNLTLKTWTGHRFINSGYFANCKNVNWVIFHDDDAFVDYAQVGRYENCLNAYFR